MARKPVFIPEIQGDNVNMGFVELMQRLLKVKVEEKDNKKKPNIITKSQKTDNDKQQR
jgi:hypothetical protein